MLVLGLCWLLVLVAGCSGSEPSPAPTGRHPGTAATSTPTRPSADPTDIAFASAIAAVERMYAEFNLALRSGRSTNYRATFADSCRYCADNARLIDTTAQRGRSIVGGQFTLTRMQKAMVHGRDVYVQGWASQAAARIEKDGKTVQRFEAAAPFLAVWTVRQVEDKWIVVQEEVPR